MTKKGREKIKDKFVSKLKCCICRCKRRIEADAHSDEWTNVRGRPHRRIWGGGLGEGLTQASAGTDAISPSRVLIHTVIWLLFTVVTNWPWPAAIKRITSRGAAPRKLRAFCSCTLWMQPARNKNFTSKLHRVEYQPVCYACWLLILRILVYCSAVPCNYRPFAYVVDLRLYFGKDSETCGNLSY